MKELAERLSALSPAQRALLELRLKKNKPASIARTIPPRQQENYCPLSLDQERIWFIQQLDPDSPAYNIYTANRFTGRMDVDALTRSLNEIVRRHQIMRTTFEAVDGKPVQVIAPHLNVDIPVVDLRALPHGEREREAERLASELVQRPFDLTRLPLFRSILLRVDDETHVCATVFHHIITDWVSFHIFERELALLYEAFLRGAAAALPELPIQYADFAAWQRQWLNGESLASHLDYWRRQLADAPLVLDLPRDRPRPVAQTPWGRRQPLALSRAHSDAIRRLAKQEEVTLFMALLAAFKALLFRLTGQQKLIVGSPIANRNLVETEDLLGFFINQLVLCTDLSGNPTFRELLHRVREVALGAYAHQEMPFGKLVEELQPERALSHTPLTQVVFLFLNPQQQGVLKFADLNVLPYTVDGESSKFDLTFSLWDNESGFEGWIEYNTDLFDATTIIRLTEQFRTLLAGIVADPDRRLSDLTLLTDAARHQLLIEWAAPDAAAEAAAGSCVHQLFEAQAARTPEAVAVASGTEILSYGELNQRADRLARHLRSLRVGPETVVGILMDRSPQMVVAMLAALKAGGAYLPLDPGDPAERVALMLTDAQAPILLTEQRLAGMVSAEQVWVLCLDSDWEQTTDEDKKPTAQAASAGNLAYVIYTSGSTGRPKGVTVEHHALANLIAWHQRAYGLQSSDRATLIAGQAFDASVWELWPYLIAGASIHIPDEETRSSPPALIKWIAAQAITLCFLPTPLAEAALAEQWPAQMALRCLLTGGDRLHRRPGQEMPFSFFNHYGPTENTVVATATRIAPDGEATLPIGRPIAGTQVYLLDAHLQPVPIGVAGELCIGGAGLARGYLNRPGLTAASFVPHPYSDEPGMRLYRTGDRARFLTDGQIEFLGRGDNQVKVRGFRIEFGEIEAALCQHEAVREAAVLAREDVPGKKRLVAYVAAVRKEVSAAELIAHLKKKLPDYMVPTAFVLLDELPLTRHGKVDRRNLPPPGSTARTLEQTFVAPRTAAERQLAEIWSQVLGVARVGIHDNFFELGGDSILSIQIIARANKAGLRLAPKQLFQHQTIAELAAVSGSGEIVRADQGIVTGAVPLTPIQHWFFEQNLSDAHHFNQSLLIEMRTGIEPGVLERAVRQVFAHHDALRLRFTSAGANWRQSHADDEQNIFTHCDLSSLTGSERGDAVAATSAAMQESLDLSGGPLARVVLFDSGAEEPSQLLIIIHHLVVDGVSWRILLEDLHAAYEQVSRDGRAALPAKTTSFKQWAEQLAEYARSEKLAEEVEYWTADARTRVRSLPLDHIGGTNTVAAARSVEVSLSVAETRALLQEVPAAYRVQINDVLLTALALAFSEWTGERLLLVDLEGHGREELFDGYDLSRTVGWFTTICPVLLDLEAADTVVDAINSVKEQLRRMPSRGIGYGLLRYLRGDDSVATQLKMLPQAEVSFNYLGQLDQTMSAASLFASAQPAAGWGRSPRAPRRYLFEISGGVAESQLTLTWQFGGEQFEPATVEKLADAYVAALRAIITHCTSSAAPGYTPSDFPLAQLDQKKLDWSASARRQLEDISPQPPPLEPAPRNGSLPVSFAQEPMWQLDQMLPGNHFFNVPVALRLSGALNLTVLERSLAEITRRHEALRTTFAEVDGEPVQIIAQASPSLLRLIDLRELSPPDRESEAARLAVAGVKQYFDLAQGPLLRINLLRLDEEEYRALVTMHHIIADAWSIGVFVRELATLYEAFLHGQPSPLPALPIQYADYAHWQRQWLQGEALENELAFWRKQLSGSLVSLNLPDGNPRSEALTFQTALRPVTLPRALSVAISESNRAEGVTLFMALLTGLQILLHRRTGQQDIRVGTLVANRNCVETEAMIGLFVNTLVIRSFLSADLTCRQALQQVRETVLAAFSHQDIPFELLLQELEREREMERTTLVEVLFILQNAPMQPLELQDLTVSPLEEDGTAAETEVTLTSFDLVLMMWEGPDGLAGSLRYKTGIFDEAMINRLLEDYQNILATIALQPLQCISAALQTVHPN